MENRDRENGTPVKGLDPQVAAALLRRKLVTIGGIAGGLMGLLWSLVAGLLFRGFPSIGSPTFLVIAFLSIVILGGAGLLTGRYAYTRIISGK